MLRFGKSTTDLIEQKFFGEVDRRGSTAVDVYGKLGGWAGGPYLNLPQKLGAPGLDFQTWERRMSEALHPMSQNRDMGHPFILG